MMVTPPPPTKITLRLPSKYSSITADGATTITTTTTTDPKHEQEPFRPPSLSWLCRTWAVTHSTLSMWRSARNVRITYKELPSTIIPPPSFPSVFFWRKKPTLLQTHVRIDDLVEYRTKKSWAPKTVAGIDTSSPSSSGGGEWDWRGKGWLSFVTSHWEILGWGEDPVTKECWVVTWFAPTLFTKEGVDVYCSRLEGFRNEELVKGVIEALERLGGAGDGGNGKGSSLAEMCKRDMRLVEISLP